MMCNTDYIYFQIRWRPVICGFTMQILMGVVVLRWQTGYDIVKWTSDKLIAFIEFTYHGSGMVYGDPFQALHNYTFMVRFNEKNCVVHIDGFASKPRTLSC